MHCAHTHCVFCFLFLFGLARLVFAAAKRICSPFFSAFVPCFSLQWSGSDQSLLSALPSLHELPFVSIPFHDGDNTYNQLGWVSPASAQMFARYFQHNAWWQEHVNFCRYAHVPVGNMASDAPAFVSDVFFARSLKDANHLLWLSRSVNPQYVLPACCVCAPVFVCAGYFLMR